MQTTASEAMNAQSALEKAGKHVQDWEAPARLATADAAEPKLVVDVDGFEGPLDLLLALARSQKVDLARISILALAEQYLEFIEEIRQTRLELAADYLVMAAWLAYLKSRLLLPTPQADDEPTGEELAAALAGRLKRLEAMRDVAARLMNRNRLGRDVFARGAPEPIAFERRLTFTATLYDLLTAYSGQRQRQAVTTVRVAKRTVWSLADARAILERLVGGVVDWTPIEAFLGAYLTQKMGVSVIASAFSASLELVREGRIELRQTEAFSQLFMRARPNKGEPDEGQSP